MGVGNEGRVERELEAGILTLTLDHPPTNTLNAGMLEQIADLRAEISSDAVSLVVFTGRGNYFSKGFDLDLIRSLRRAEDLRRSLADSNRLYSWIADLSKPTIAAINGHCFGGGLELALACHFRICSEKARLGLGELSYGVIPGLGGIHRLARVVGEAKALEMIALSDVIDAAEALRLNLVNRVASREGFRDCVRSFARALLLVPPTFLAEVTRLVRSSRDRSEEENVREAIESFVRLAGWIQK